MAFSRLLGPASVPALAPDLAPDSDSASPGTFPTFRFRSHHPLLYRLAIGPVAVPLRVFGFIVSPSFKVIVNASFKLVVNPSFKLVVF